MAPLSLRVSCPGRTRPAWSNASWCCPLPSSRSMWTPARGMRTMAKTKATPFLVADLDDTLVRKLPPGTKGPCSLLESACLEPLVTWLGSGKGLVVVTTDDGHRPYRNFWNQLPATARAGDCFLSTSDGAMLFKGDAAGDLQEVPAYRARAASLALHARPDARATGTGLPADAAGMDELIRICRGMLLSFVADLARNDGSPCLSELPEALQQTYGRVLERMEAGEALEEILSVDAVTTPGAILPRGSCLWRNQAGPASEWVRGGREDGPWFGYTAAPGAAPPFFTNLFVMALPRPHSQRYIDAAAPALAPLGLVASAAPNSVCVKSAAVDKSLPLKFLHEAPDCAFRFENAVAFGDNPRGNDGPLAYCSGAMPFVSVSGAAADTPEDLQALWVGHLERGTAAVVAALNAAGAEGRAVDMEAVAQEVRAQLQPACSL